MVRKKAAMLPACAVSPTFPIPFTALVYMSSCCKWGAKPPTSNPTRTLIAGKISVFIFWQGLF
jgi:hypothetical protein